MLDIEKAIEGAPVRLRNGLKAYVRHHETSLETNYPLQGYIVYKSGTTRVCAWGGEGKLYCTEAHPWDIIGMWSADFQHWDVLSPCISQLEKTAPETWVGKTLQGETILVLNEKNFSPNFFPDAAVGTITRRPQ